MNIPSCYFSTENSDCVLLPNKKLKWPLLKSRRLYATIRSSHNETTGLILTVYNNVNFIFCFGNIEWNLIVLQEGLGDKVNASFRVQLITVHVSFSRSLSLSLSLSTFWNVQARRACYYFDYASNQSFLLLSGICPLRTVHQTSVPATGLWLPSLSVRPLWSVSRKNPYCRMRGNWITMCYI
jgi:hypothetical protein